MTRLIRYMPAVAGYRERLATLQGTWDSLALLSHLSEEGMNLSGTRQEFETLAGDLIKHLEAETHKKALAAARARAQMAIDVLVRNLFERTADVGFLAADPSLREFAQERAAGRGERRNGHVIAGRLAEYVAKYSVYRNVILLSPAGEVLAQLDSGTAPARTRDPLVERTLSTDRAYVETFRPSDLVPDSRRALLYSHRVMADGQMLGVLCLCFRFEDECEAIFGGLRVAGDWSVLSLLSADNEVIATSDAHQLPLGVKVPTGERDSGEIVRFAGREFLAITRSAQSYQGYAGPGWRGHVMVPLDRAFEFDGQLDGQLEDPQGGRQSGLTEEVLADLRASAATFSRDLRQIPKHADAVQRDLNRSVWNGGIRLSLHKNGSGAFAKALLREISNMGRKTQEIFERSIQDLHETVLSSVLHDSRFMASLAIEIQARNLYERANDCRWWALDATLIGRLAGVPECTDEAASRVLSHINQLYTVYHAIVLLDAQCRVVASSRAAHVALVGQQVEEPWAREALGLSTTQNYSVSEFAPSVLHDGRPVLIYAAAVRSPQGRTIGVVGVVFDTAPQLSAMLRDALPRDEAGEPLSGCVAAFLDSRLQPMCATDPDFKLDGLDLEWIRRAPREGNARVVRIGESYCAVGVKPDTGYREYRGIGGFAVTLIPVGEVPRRRAAHTIAAPRIARVSGVKRDLVEFATLAIGESWYALPASAVIEAIDAKGLQSLPSRQSWCAGLVMFAGEPLAVADIQALLGAAEVGSGSVVVVIRAPSSGKPIGILADALGQICEVPRERLLAIGDPERVLTPFAIEPEDAGDPLVLAMNPQRLEWLIRGESRADAA